jgi:hypothetical protein
LVVKGGDNNEREVGKEFEIEGRCRLKSAALYSESLNYRIGQYP